MVIPRPRWTALPPLEMACRPRSIALRGSFGDEMAGVGRPAHLDRVAHFEEFRTSALRVCAKRLDAIAVLRGDLVDGHIAHVQQLRHGAAVTTIVRLRGGGLDANLFRPQRDRATLPWRNV